MRFVSFRDLSDSAYAKTDQRKALRDIVFALDDANSPQDKNEI